MISENIDNITVLPEYILKAISFACPNVSKGALISMAHYRLSSLEKRHFDKDENDYKGLLKSLAEFDDQEEAIAFFKEKLPQDVLTQLIDLLDA